MIVIIDYGMGNLMSVKKAFSRIGAEVKISNKVQDIESAERLILPGVGHFGCGVENLESLGLINCLKSKVLQQKTPILGICLGMQLMVNHSSEGNGQGLSFINLETVKICNDELKVPHMGWNSVTAQDHPSILLTGIKDDDLFYFVHSYWVKVKTGVGADIGLTEYGQKFISLFSMNNIHGVQFHPEKSHDQGLKLLTNFLKT